MPDTKLIDLTEDTAPASDSLVYTTDAPATAPVDRKVSLANFGKGLTTVSNITGLYKGTSGTISAAVAGTDYVPVSIKETENIEVEFMLEGAAPPQATTILTSTNKVPVRNFDSTTDEDLLINWEVPVDLSGTTISFRVIGFIINATGPSNEGWAFFLQGASIGDGDGLGASLGTAVKSSITARTDAQYDRVATAWSADVTITSLLAGETALLKLYRDVSDADDTYAQDVGVARVEIKYTRAISTT